jgi:hypothetical protein
LDIHLDTNEIALVKKAARAFAVCYVNEIINTIKSIDPSAVEKLVISKKYPFYLHLFIDQEIPGVIKQLDIYSEHKNNGDGLSEVKEIYHTSECDITEIEEIKKNLAGKCINWRWNWLELGKMYTLSITEGKKVGWSIYNRFVLSFGGTYPRSFVNHLNSISMPAHKSMGYGTRSH